MIWDGSHAWSTQAVSDGGVAGLEAGGVAASSPAGTEAGVAASSPAGTLLCDVFDA